MPDAADPLNPTKATRPVRGGTTPFDLAGLSGTVGDAPVPDVVADSTPDLTRPATKGKDDGPPDLPGYEILGELGRGGMGIVFKAHQRALNRLVALKIIRGNETRFQAEAEAIAALQHPNVCQVYEVGRVNGKPYLALEFCAGGSLTDQLRDQLLAPRPAAQLVRTLALAMQAAHELGILHRDLKPDNILFTAPRDIARSPESGVRNAGPSSSTRNPKSVAKSQPSVGGSSATIGDSRLTVSEARVTLGDPRGPLADPRLPIPKITDFGLAKRFDTFSGEAASGRTQAGVMLGTPSYMAPEQAEGNAAISSDVYSLGAVLYECLTGRPPFRRANAMDTVLAVLEEEPIAPGKLTPNLPRELEAICLKCLEKQPAKRYPTAVELADDLARFIEGLPTLAKPLPRWRRAVKWAKRRPAVASLIVTGCLSLVALSALSAGLWKAWRETDREREHAVASMNVAMSAVDDLLEQEELPGGGDPEVQRQAMLDSVGRSLERLGRYAGDNGELLARSMKALVGRGRLLIDVGRLDDAINVYGEAVSLARKQLTAHADDVAWRRELAVALNRLGGAYDRARRENDARKSYQEAEDIRRALTDSTGAADDEHDLAVTLFNRAGLDAMSSEHRAQATERFHDARRRLIALVKRHPSRADYQNSLGRCWYNWAWNLARADQRSDEAIAAYDQARSQWQDLVNRHETSTLYQTRLAQCQNELGRLHHTRNEPAEALDNYSAALATWREVVKRHPKVSHYQGMLGVTCSNLGQLADAGQQLESRSALLEEAVRLLTNVQNLPEFRPKLADALLAQARMLKARGESEAAGRAYDRAIERYEVLTTDQPREMEYRTRLAQARAERAQVKMID